MSKISENIEAAKRGEDVKTSKYNPWILVTKRSFAFALPGDPFGVTGNVTVISEIGVTFLCANFPAFSFLRQALTHAPPAEPTGGHAHAEIRAMNPSPFPRQPYVDEHNGRRTAKMEEDLVRGFRAFGVGDSVRHDYAKPDLSRFATAPGDATPDAMLVQVRTIWGVDKVSQDAQAILRATIPMAKSGTMVGMLHDFAVLAGANGVTIAEECRRRAIACKWDR